METEKRNQWLIDNMKFVFTVCKKFRNRDDYEDVQQTAFMATLDALSRVREGANEKEIRAYVARWIDGVVHRECYISTFYVPYRDRYKVKLNVISTDMTFDSEDGTDGLTFEEAYLPSTERGYDEVMMKVDFLNKISMLSETIRNRGLLLIDGYSQSEIAKAEGVKPQAIGCSIYKIQDIYKRSVG